ncbi:spore coat protein [Mesobacillus foraminis]|uniref:spore coat protein n=1 Tax=Mesobacillus foraminis TaxID=279826 RepID=UPI0020362366|nr:spore coat protein [Mesobacillus foraminis]
MTMQLGAHEALELHEVLNDAIHGLNTMKLYRPHVKDQNLLSMMDRHMNTCMMEYNNMVAMANQHGASQAVPVRHSISNSGFQPTYGLHNPQTQTPAVNVGEIGDQDAAIYLINSHKQTASLKMKAALEMAHPTLRRIMQQAANTSADMAYEGFQYANQKGYYQVPTLKDTTQDTFLDAYGTTPMMNANQGGTPLM